MEYSEELFTIIGCDEAQGEKIGRPQTTYWKDAWRRLRQNKVAIFAMIILILIIFLSLFGSSI